MAQLHAYLAVKYQQMHKKFCTSHRWKHLINRREDYEWWKKSFNMSNESKSKAYIDIIGAF